MRQAEKGVAVLTGTPPGEADAGNYVVVATS